MITAPVTPGQHRERHRQPWSLQTRLMVTVIGIVTLTLAIIALATSALLAQVLQTSVTATLKSLTDDVVRGVLQVKTTSPDGVTAYDVLTTGPLPRNSLLVLYGPDGSASGAYISDNRVVNELTNAQVNQVLTADRELPPDSSAPHGTLTMNIDGLGAYTLDASQTIGLIDQQRWITVVGIPPSTIGAQVLVVIVLATAGGMLLLSAGIAVVIRRGLRPLRAVADTATRVAALPMAEGKVSISERVPEDASDSRSEIGQVAHALNTLLDHVDTSLEARQRNEERMRQFVADASHELRTPLASIRGYSELSLRAIRMQNRENPADTDTDSPTESALERIQAQSLRMTALVDDLLLLARLDEGQELVYASVDLTRLTVESVEDARAAGREHVWLLDVTEEPVLIAGDTARLHQVLANLLANARTHTPPGTEVTVTLVSTPNSAIVRVHDNGPGIDPSVADELFERFSRADRSRARKTGGTGLGMSIARAIVDAHGGTITVRSQPGDTNFEVSLPSSAPDPTDQ